MKVFASLFFVVMTGCQPCPQGDNACYKFRYGLVPDETRASGYRPMSLGEYLFGEKKLEKNQENP
ncbi:MAG: hypothetical protein DRP65_04175 [Planctomycetota bacterium]|nr:MAG: hypothetical protein DRP65_04175 [Planctomycetota bacterium]